MVSGSLLGKGWIDADPILVALVIAAIALAAVIHVVRRVAKVGGS